MTKTPALLTSLVLVASLAAPAQAVEVRPQGYLERGVLEWTDQGVVFMPDSERGQRGGRWFRLEGSEMQIFYGLGGSTGTDWLWPTHTVSSAVWDIISASPGGVNYLSRYQDGANYTQGFARAGSLVMYTGLLGAIGGFIYNLTLTNSTRELNPIWYLGAAGVFAAGLGIYAGASAGAGTNEALLDQAIDAYNREMAGRRRRGPVTNPYVPQQPDYRAPGTMDTPRYNP